MNRRGVTPLHYAADGYIVGPAWDAEQQERTIHVFSRPGQISTHETKTASHRSTAPFAPVVPPR